MAAMFAGCGDAASVCRSFVRAKCCGEAGMFWSSRRRSPFSPFDEAFDRARGNRNVPEPPPRARVIATSRDHRYVPGQSPRPCTGNTNWNDDHLMTRRRSHPKYEKGSGPMYQISACLAVRNFNEMMGDFTNVSLSVRLFRFGLRPRAAIVPSSLKYNINAP